MHREPVVAHGAGVAILASLPLPATNGCKSLPVRLASVLPLGGARGSPVLLLALLVAGRDQVLVHLIIICSTLRHRFSPKCGNGHGALCQSIFRASKHHR